MLNNPASGEKRTAQLDELDRRLLALLSENSRRTNNSLAEELGIAASTCLARLNALRDSGVISRFTIEVDPQVLGRELEALIFVKIRPGARHLMSSFASDMRAKPGVRQLFFLGGADDFVLHVAVRNSSDVRQFVLDNLSANPAVATTQTSLVFEHSHGTDEY
ncbi:AsnC family transcriptional regulator [Arthrobacter sp. MYb211]|uniref:Lrp/AsnC family transcriptional regulator n=1 Tax=Micrococcaceae TaxID=1268 RepID=UPI000CFBA6A6|nr:MULTISPECIES: Lrp/AsnC family transcriptional regulator [unclassified Arthrobacter]PRA00487.1 AsnC family transcriptional regulator [Arthrobacter sp. MYb224]PRA04679.1 AsnC family transcriptional regulator [Arthrobacter sp. MYb229]PRA10647.1 AsnC family transcriptional regulator [Arthrobacter sp. MYb221]PRB51407.1 AsnC family transcriptional regulator [Arthrobacter sp. MYb216]PRC06340.1 AsnC family transcriptional regulator [Arthrobacter sp. MYb211]